MILATSKHRYSVSVDDKMFKEIEDFRFERRYQTRSEATVELIRLGLEMLKNERNEEA
ncbi:ribbon-helix-helix domain-containing protein [Clostridium sp. D33t1_170424_F3]|uniref:ribbon-helix-helix domain-containing protein n=1 Tax=Clostridium sp. D33t1_170424_F3 TaxID=2787099 RepID=UPI0025702C10|nr:ribbon-helix-helix domain-containing protein [Clostridium sp. D33t1_170424_F3]